jgi:hypothetical protein
MLLPIGSQVLSMRLTVAGPVAAKLKVEVSHQHWLASEYGPPVRVALA